MLTIEIPANTDNTEKTQKTVIEFTDIYRQQYRDRET